MDKPVPTVGPKDAVVKTQALVCTSDTHTLSGAIAERRDLTLGHEAVGHVEAAVKATRPGGTISVVGYFGQGEYIHIPRIAWGVGMSDKTIRTGLFRAGASACRASCG